MSQPESHPPPRAFAQGVGTIFQLLGGLLFFISCTICCGSSLISKDAATKTNLTHIGWHFSGDAKDAPTYSAQKALTICVFAAVFFGLALAAIGLGLQAEHRAAGMFGIAATALGTLFWFTHAFFAGTVGGSYLLSLIAAGLGLGSAILLGFSIAATYEMKRNPPPARHEILPASYKIPYSHYHDDPPEVRLAAELEQRRQKIATQQKELEMLEEKLKRKLEGEDPDPEKKL
jgi:hypothetical protein